MKKRTKITFLAYIVILFAFNLIIVEEIAYQPMIKSNLNLTINNPSISYNIDWTANGTEICTADDQQKSLQLVSDGAGGAIIVWQDKRSGTNWDIYAQRINTSGDVQWIKDGVPICTVSDNQTIPQLINDGANGAIITWQDRRNGNYDIYAQRVNASGMVLWTTDGVPICTAVESQGYLQLVSDGKNGAIIVWEDERSEGFPNYQDIYAQRVNATGVVQWIIDGVPICTDDTLQWFPQLISDGAGGAIITWQDYRSGWDIYAQRVDATGVVQWTTDGVPICTASLSQYEPKLVNDGAGGAIITWLDFRMGSWDIYVQRISAAGIIQWTADGVPICTLAWTQAYSQLVSDGAGGAIITWQDARIQNGEWDIYAQKINAAGISQWTANGVPICTAGDNQTSPQLVSDGVGGAIITWQDERMGNWDIAAQKINAAGAGQWIYNGIPICTAVLDQISPQLVSDEAEGAMIAWQDYRNSWDCDIYAQKINDARPPAAGVPYGGGGDDDGDGNDKEGEAIPGYEIFIIISLISTISIVLLKKYKKTIVK